MTTDLAIRRSETDVSFSVEISHVPALNFAMEQAGIPVISNVRVANTGAQTYGPVELAIAIEPNLAERQVFRIGAVRAGDTVELPPLDFKLQPSRLRTVLEAERAELTWELRGPDKVLAAERRTIEVLAYNEWVGLRAPPALLATYVTPNAPVVAGILAKVHERLRAATGDGAISGYQTRSEARVRSMIRALYETLQSLGIAYVSTPASFESVGQKVRLADAVLRESHGNCLDLTVLVASCLEQMGISPLVVLKRGHAFPGAWLCDDRFLEGVVYDCARLRNSVALTQVVLFDSSAMVAEPPITFDEACVVALRSLDDNAAFQCAIDVVVARRDRYRPLPLRELKQSSGPPKSQAVPEPVREILEDVALRREPSNDPQADVPEKAAKPASGDRFRTWREKLLDLSLRNKLLNYRHDVKGTLRLDIPNLARFEDLLAADESFQVHPRPSDARDRRDDQLVRARGGDHQRSEGLAADLDKKILHTPLEEPALAKQATVIKRASREAIEEGGSNVLYVALGFLKWFESDSSEQERLAPLLLVPVALEYTPNTKKVQLRHLPEESLPNWTLAEKLRADFGLELTALTEVEPDDSGVDVPALLHGTRQAISHMSRWEVLEEAHLGLFSFTKYLMWRDLGDNQDVLLENKVIRHIVSKQPGAFDAGAAAVEPAQLDDDVPPAKLPLVVDADSTQTAAVASALRGRSFVLQGPPGTGKSQTITNLIAAFIADGKTVLFVSEKMAALEVVYRRLQSVGLGDFCLELHSHKAQKRELVQALGRTLDRVERTSAARWDEQSADLAAQRGKLNGYTRALHAPTPLGLTFHQASARLLALASAPRVRILRQQGVVLTRDDFRAALEASAGFARAAAQVEPVREAIFRECSLDGWSAQREQDTRDAIERSQHALSAVAAASTELRRLLRIDSSVSLSALADLSQLSVNACAGILPAAYRDADAWRRLDEQVEAYRTLSDAQTRRRADLAKRWKDDLYQAELMDLEAAFARWAGAFVLFAWLFLFGARRRLLTLAAGALPGSRQIAADLPRVREANAAEQPIADAKRALERQLEGCGVSLEAAALEALLARGRALREVLDRVRARLDVPLDTIMSLPEPATPPAQRAAIEGSARAAIAALQTYRDAMETLRVLMALPEGVWPPEHDPQHVEQVRAKLATWQTGFERYRPWCLYRAARRELIAKGGAPIVEAHALGDLVSADCEAACERGFLEGWANTMRDADENLRQFDGQQHHALVERFRATDIGHVRDARKRVASLLEARLPSATAHVAESSEPGILRRELGKKRGHMPLRKLLQSIPNLLPRLKPCLLMCPLSIAQYLPARGRRFDLVVFDEASQICTHDAIGAIGRGDQVIVVGDSKQLPPTAFFARAAANDDASADENDFTELESVLDEARASGMPEQMLGWHYRSRHETLIEFSNHHYYDGKLNVFPAARADVADLGVKFHLVKDAAYELGRSRTNPREARALVDFLVARLQAYSATQRTFGIVTFSTAQRDVIEDLLEEARSKYPQLEPHFAHDHPSFEKVFVKNLENVQGDERDEILFSVAYAPDENDKMLMNFGPLNRDGGERRLNVAVTRARKQLRVFSSMTAERIDTNRTRAVGAHHLKAFLRFAAERGGSAMERKGERSGDFDSDFERAVFDFLRSKGYKVDTQVGCSGFRIDMAVVHPTEAGVYALGIECDGAAYHSGATARDRDRLRQQVLEGLGWRLHRIWSTDWMYTRNREGERLVAAIEAAVQAAPFKSPLPVVPIKAPMPAPQAAPLMAAKPAAPASPVVPYQRASLPSVSDDPESLYESSRQAALKKAIAEVARVEAPIHVDELARRAAEAFGVRRLSVKVRRRVQEVLATVPGYVLHGDFVWSAAAKRSVDIPIREGDAREAEIIAAEEIASAARWILQQALSMPLADLARDTARLFGIQRVGAKVEARMRVGIELLLSAGLCRLEGEQITWQGDVGSNS